MLQLRFINPNERIQGENKSKLLDPECSLYMYVKHVRDLLNSHGIVFDARPPHIELSRVSNLDPVVLAQRAASLHNTKVSNEVELMVHKALVVPTGVVQDYGMTHCTIAYFKQSLSDDQYDTLIKIIHSAATQEQITEFVNQTKTAACAAVQRKDWYCEKCKFTVFASKPQCKKCGTQRPM
jgi:hypothetical protein